jgi:hypothetical protein
MDGVADQVRLGAGAGALGQAVEAMKRGERIVGVQGRDAARVAGLPGVEQLGSARAARISGPRALARDSR